MTYTYQSSNFLSDLWRGCGAWKNLSIFLLYAQKNFETNIRTIKVTTYSANWLCLLRLAIWAKRRTSCAVKLFDQTYDAYVVHEWSFWELCYTSKKVWREYQNESSRYMRANWLFFWKSWKSFISKHILLKIIYFEKNMLRNEGFST